MLRYLQLFIETSKYWRLYEYKNAKTLDAKCEQEFS